MNRILGKDTLEALDNIANLSLHIINATETEEDLHLSNDSLALLSNGYLFLYHKLQELNMIGSFKKQLLH